MRAGVTTALLHPSLNRPHVPAPFTYILSCTPSCVLPTARGAIAPEAGALIFRRKERSLCNLAQSLPHTAFYIASAPLDANTVRPDCTGRPLRLGPRELRLVHFVGGSPIFLAISRIWRQRSMQRLPPQRTLSTKKSLFADPTERSIPRSHPVRAEFPYEHKHVRLHQNRDASDKKPTNMLANPHVRALTVRHTTSTHRSDVSASRANANLRPNKCCARRRARQTERSATHPNPIDAPG